MACYPRGYCPNKKGEINKAPTSANNCSTKRQILAGFKIFSGVQIKIFIKKSVSEPEARFLFFSASTDETYNKVTEDYTYYEYYCKRGINQGIANKECFHNIISLQALGW